MLIPSSSAFTHPESPQLHSRMSPGPLKDGRNSRHEKGDRGSRFLPHARELLQERRETVASKEPHPQEREQGGVHRTHQGAPRSPLACILGRSPGTPWPEAPASAHHCWSHTGTAQPCLPCPQRPQPHLPQSLQAGEHSLPRALCSRQAGTGAPGRGEILNSPTPCSALHTHR